MNIINRITLKHIMRVALPLCVVVFFTALISVLYSNKPEPKLRNQSIKKTKVFVMTSQVDERLLSVFSQGEVASVSVVELRSEVSGRVLDVSEQLVAGGAFKQGDILMRIDPAEYNLTVIQRRARVAQAQQQYATAKAESDAAIEELIAMNRHEASDLAKGLPQLKQAEALLASAEAELELAQLDLSYTELKAPFDGRVQDESVSKGQYISQNSNIATLFSTDAVEIRLPLTPNQLTQINLPLAFFSNIEDSPFNVVLTMDLGKERIYWNAKIVRTEAVVDSRTRTIYAVARVNNPYTAGSRPLLMGAFTQAEISGTARVAVSEIPVKALRNGRDLWLVDKDNKLNIVQANIVQRSRDRLLVDGLASGTRVVVSTLPIPTQGMPIAIADPNAEDVLRPELVNEKGKSTRDFKKDSMNKPKALSKKAG